MPSQIKEALEVDSERFLAKFLTDETVQCPATLTVQNFLDAVCKNQVEGLVFAQLGKLATLEDWQLQVKTALKKQVLDLSVREQLWKQEFMQVAQALHAEELPFLLFKGSSLAYHVYEKPYHRPRCDSDLLIPKNFVPKVKSVMAGLGYTESFAPEGEHISHQFIMEKKDALGFEHFYDFHWDVFNPLAFSKLYTFEALYKDSKPLNQLSSVARGVSDKHALQIACVHRMAHHYDSDFLPWLCDIHLLLRGKDDNWLELFWQDCHHRGIQRYCARGILLTTERFGSFLPERWEEVLRECLKEGGSQLSKNTWTSQTNLFSVLCSDLSAAPSWKVKWQLIREHVFPAPAYILKKYKKRSRLWLPALYLFRFVRGIPKWFSRPK